MGGSAQRGDKPRAAAATGPSRESTLKNEKIRILSKTAAIRA